jgi:predicted ribosome quality control (RQC) complex YloA/Tae2 family protein
VVAFAPYRLRHLESACEVVDVESMSAAVELGYARPPTAGPAPTATALARPLVEAIDARRALVERRRAALARAREAAGDPDEPRVAGQAILAAAHSIRPGQESLEVEGRRIRLDPRESAAENARRYFREYKKAREAARRVPELLERADRELEHLDDMRTLAELASDPDSVRALREELRSSGILQDRAPRARKGSPVARAKPLSVPLSDGFVALVGTSARSNEEVTFDLAGQDDVWLHARRLPGAHVIVRTGGRPLPRHVLLEAAGLAAHFSRGREAGRVAIDWTLRRHVRKIRGGPPGLVSYVEEKSVEVPPRAPDARR